MIPSSFFDNIPLFQQINQFDMLVNRKNARPGMRSAELASLEKLSRLLEPGEDERQSLVDNAGSYASDFVNSLQESDGYTPAEITNLRSMNFSEEPKDISDLLKLMGTELDEGGINSASGRHMGYIPGGGLFTSAIADFLAAATNRYAGIAYSSPGAVEIENQVLRWMISLVGFPASAHGNLTSGGSVANLIAIKAARDAHGINSTNVRSSVVYLSSHTHHCIEGALQITGLHEAIIRKISVNDAFRMNSTALLQTIQDDLEEGLNPFLVVGTAGSTDTGSIDPLNEIAAICRQHGAWFHVDAAYGGFFMMVEEMREKFRGIEKANSIVMDPHKTLFVPYGSGVVLVRNRRDLIESNAGTASYMKDSMGFDDPDPADTGIELSRHFRGLRIWLPLHVHGLAPFRAALEEKILLCRHFKRGMQSAGFETGPEPDLSVSIFRMPGDTDNHLTNQLLLGLHKHGRVFFSSTIIQEKVWIRCAIVNFRTHLKEVNEALEMIRTIAGGIKND